MVVKTCHRKAIFEAKTLAKIVSIELHPGEGGSPGGRIKGRRSDDGRY